MTVDLDLVIDLSADNIHAALRALTDLGLRPRLPVDIDDFADPVTRADWVDNRHLVAFTLHDPNDSRREVDLFADPPITFSDLAVRADKLDVAGVLVPVASIEDLVAMKQRADRPQDRADIAALSALNELPEGVAPILDPDE